VKLFWKWAYGAGSTAGFILTGFYIVMIVATVLAGVLYPSNDGLSWVLFVIVALPWSLFAPSLPFAAVGTLLNVALLYVLAAGVEFRVRRFHRQR
jgi:cytochrome b561